MRRIVSTKDRRLPRIGTLAVMLMAVVALSAVTAASAAAEKLDLTYEFGAKQESLNQNFDVVVANGPFEGGTATIEGNPGWGTVTCATEVNSTGWEGVDKTNNQATDKAQLNSGHGVFAGEGTCSNNSGLGSTATIGFNPDGATLNLGATGAASLVAKYSSEPITLSVSYSGGDVCNYSATRLNGALTLVPYYEEWHQLNTTFTKAPLTLVKAGSARECSKKVFFTSQFGFAVNIEGYSDQFGDGYFVFGHLVP